MNTKYVGQIVQYTARPFGSLHGSPMLFAAITGKINTDGTLGLHVLTPTGTHWIEAAPFTEASPGTEAALNKYTLVPTN